MRWPFAEWGATAVLAGHDHTYERLEVDGLPYFVNGLGGHSIYELEDVVEGSRVRFNEDYGAMRVQASDSAITFRFVDRSGAEVDELTLPAGSLSPGAPDLTAELPSPLPATAIGGEKGRLKFRVANEGTAATSGSVTLELFASADDEFDEGDVAIGEATRNLKLKPGRGRVLAVPFIYPDGVDGPHVLIARVEGGGETEASASSGNVAAADAAVMLARPTVSLAGAFDTGRVPVLRPGGRVSAALSVSNDGNVPARGALPVRLQLARADGGPAVELPDGSFDVRLRPGTSRRFKLKFVRPSDLPGGTYEIVATLDPEGQMRRNDDGADSATSPPFTITA